jgi:hypothetical protein
VQTGSCSRSGPSWFPDTVRAICSGRHPTKGDSRERRRLRAGAGRPLARGPRSVTPLRGRVITLRRRIWAVFLLRREGLVVRLVKDLRTGTGFCCRISVTPAAESRVAPSCRISVTPNRAITNRPAGRHAGDRHEPGLQGLGGVTRWNHRHMRSRSLARRAPRCARSSTTARSPSGPGQPPSGPSCPIGELCPG